MPKQLRLGLISVGLPAVLHTILLPRRFAVFVVSPCGASGDLLELPRLIVTHVEQTVAKNITTPKLACRQRQMHSLSFQPLRRATRMNLNLKLVLVYKKI